MSDQAENLRRKLALSRNQKQENSKQQRQAKTISIISGKGGVGKSSTAINFALELIRNNLKVLIIDLDIGMGNIEIMLGLHAEKTLIDLFEEQVPIEEVIAKGPNNLAYIPGGSGFNDIFSLTEDQKRIFYEKYNELALMYDYILFDMGAGLSQDSLFFILSSDECIVITTPEPTALTDAYSIIKLLIHNKKNMSINIIMNRCNTETEGIRSLKQFEQIIDRFLSVRVQNLGILLEDKVVPQSIIKQSPYILSHSKSKVARSMGQVAANYLSYDRGSEIKPDRKTFIERLRSYITGK